MGQQTLMRGCPRLKALLHFILQLDKKVCLFNHQTLGGGPLKACKDRGVNSEGNLQCMYFFLEYYEAQ